MSVVEDRHELVVIGRTAVITRWKLDESGAVTRVIAPGWVIRDRYSPAGSTLVVARRADGVEWWGDYREFAVLDTRTEELVFRAPTPSFGVMWAGESTLLGDFGVAYAIDSKSTVLTQPGEPKGTILYMAPEQLREEAVTERTDLYAVGCLAYWLITGHLVFKGRTTMETMVQHAHDVPVPPSTRTEMEIPSALDAIVLACLAKNPDDRPPSADALAEALVSIATRSPWTTQRAREWWDLHRPAVSA